MDVEREVSVEIFYAEPFIRRDFACLQRLLDVLYDDPRFPRRMLTRQRLEQVANNGWIVAARMWKTERIIGMASLTRQDKLGRTAWWIDDVVVEKKFRHHGICTAILKKLFWLAEEQGVSTLDLHSTRPNAIKLYKRLGFHKRESTLMQRKI